MLSTARQRTVTVVFRTSNVVVSIGYDEQSAHPGTVPTARKCRTGCGNWPSSSPIRSPGSPLGPVGGPDPQSPEREPHRFSTAYRGPRTRSDRTIHERHEWNHERHE
uniref:Uncharacterized protein n=1 Tax=Streptomyces avermitilis TaxID=33903 RepID=A0A499VED3_STRAX|nr:hypothetical protein SAVMC3_54420 [Streptomyces avermitilis]